MTMGDRPKRSLAKAITWRALATLATIVIVYAFTRELVASLGVGLVEVVAKMALYYAHERAWGRIGWGRASAGLAPVSSAE